MTPDDLLARLLFRDANMLIIDKPAGLPVHAGPKGGPNLEMYLDALRFGLPRMPALAHRLDRDTSGCLVLGRHRKALRRLGEMFASGRVEKTYWAVVEGSPKQDEGRIEMSLSKVHKTYGWKMKPDVFGQSAVTDYRVLGRGEGRAWVEFRPRTGRTHQIRVHCSHALGTPIIGDPVYGNAAPDGGFQHLHARAISLPYYPNKPAISKFAPPPPHMLDTLKACGYAPAEDVEAGVDVHAHETPKRASA